MFTTKKKIQKDKDAEPTEFEETVAQVLLCCLLINLILVLWYSTMLNKWCLIWLQALFDLENTNQELKSDLKDLYINQAMYV